MRSGDATTEQYCTHVKPFQDVWRRKIRCVNSLSCWIRNLSASAKISSGGRRMKFSRYERPRRRLRREIGSEQIGTRCWAPFLIICPRARRRPDFARPRRGQPSLYFTPPPGAPKRSDGGLLLEKLSSPT